MSQNFNVHNTDNIFSTFPQYNVMMQDKTSNNLYNDKTKDSLELQNNNNSKKKFILGTGIASTVFAAGVLGLLLMKGFHGSSISKLSESLSGEFQEVKTTSAQTTRYYAKKGMDRTLGTLQSISNITALKDTLFDRLLNTNSIGKKFADAAREFERKIVDRALNMLYNKVSIQISDMTSLLKHCNIRNLKNLDSSQIIGIKDEQKALGEWIDELNTQVSILEQSYNEGFSLGARKSRNIKRNQLLTGIGQKIRNVFFKDGGWHNHETYKTYATERVSRESQRILKNDIITARKKVTNNIDVIHENIKDKLSDIIYSIKPKDKVTKEILDTTVKHLENFKSCSGVLESQERTNISQQIIIDIDKAISKINEEQIYSEVEKKDLIFKLENIKNQVFFANKNSKGALENVLTILKGLNIVKQNGKQIISDTELKQLEKLAQDISKNLKEATDKELSTYFLKQAELEAGSAATDIFSVLFPIGAGAYAISKCHDNDERMSAALKVCIPLVGMFGTFAYGMTRMLAGAKSLVFSFFSGFILNKTGTYVDNLYKNYKKSGSVKEVAKTEYRNMMYNTSEQEKNNKTFIKV